VFDRRLERFKRALGLAALIVGLVVPVASGAAFGGTIGRAVFGGSSSPTGDRS